MWLAIALVIIGALAALCFRWWLDRIHPVAKDVNGDHLEALRARVSELSEEVELLKFNRGLRNTTKQQSNGEERL